MLQLPMSEFSKRDKTIALLLCWGFTLALLLWIILIDDFQSIGRAFTFLEQSARSGGVELFEAIWFGCLAISIAIVLWARHLRARLWRSSPPWLGLSAYWLFNLICGGLGFIFNFICIMYVSVLPVSILYILQGGVLSNAFCCLTILGVVRSFPEPREKK